MGRLWITIIIGLLFVGPKPQQDTGPDFFQTGLGECSSGGPSLQVLERARLERSVGFKATYTRLLKEYLRRLCYTTFWRLNSKRWHLLLFLSWPLRCLLWVTCAVCGDIASRWEDICNPLLLCAYGIAGDVDRSTSACLAAVTVGILRYENFHFRKMWLCRGVSASLAMVMYPDSGICVLCALFPLLGTSDVEANSEEEGDVGVSEHTSRLPPWRRRRVETLRGPPSHGRNDSVQATSSVETLRGYPLDGINDNVRPTGTHDRNIEEAASSHHPPGPGLGVSSRLVRRRLDDVRRLTECPYEQHGQSPRVGIQPLTEDPIKDVWGYVVEANELNESQGS